MITSTSRPFFGANPLNSHRLMCTGIGCCETYRKASAGSVNPGVDLLVVIVAVALQRSEFHLVAAPDEPVRRLVTGQGEREGPGNLLQRLRDRPECHEHFPRGIHDSPAFVDDVSDRRIISSLQPPRRSNCSTNGRQRQRRATAKSRSTGMGLASIIPACASRLSPRVTAARPG